MSEQELQQDFEDRVEELDEQLEQEVEDVVEEAAEAQEELPKGYKSYDQYIEEGGDPDMYRGKKAYEQFYDKNQELKTLKGEIKEVKNGIEHMVQAQQDAHNQNVAKIMADFEDQMAKAEQELDFDKYKEAAKQKADLQKQTIAKAPEVKNNFQSTITNFRNNNPALDPNSPEYDEDLDGLVVQRVNNKWKKLNPSAVGEADIQELLNESLNAVKGKFAKYQTKTPKTPPKTRQATKKSVQSTGKSLSELSDSERGIYDAVLQASGETAAKNFLKRVGA